MRLLGKDIRELDLSEETVIEFLRKLDHGKETSLFESDSDLETVQMSQYLRLFQTIEMIDKYIRDEKSLMTYELIVAEEKPLYMVTKFTVFVTASYNTYREKEDIIWLYLPMKALPIKGTLNSMLHLRDYIAKINMKG